MAEPPPSENDAAASTSVVKPLLPLAGATCLNTIALGTVIPLLPFYVTELGGGSFEAAAIFSIFSAFSFLSAPFWGRLSDQIGRKPVMLLSVLATITAYIWLAHADQLWELFASRALAGLTAGWLATSHAFVSDVTGEKNRAKGMGVIGAAFGIGFTVGPALGAVSIDNQALNFLIPAYISAGCAFMAFLVTLLLVKEPPRHHETKATLMANLDRVIGNPSLRALFLPYFLVVFVFTGMEGVFALWGLQTLGFGPTEVGYFLALSGIVNAFVQGGLVGRLVGRLGEVKVAAIGASLLAITALTLALANSLALVAVAMALLAVAMGFFNPAMQSLMSQRSPEDWKGGVLGAAQSCASFARIAGPALGGLALEHIGVTSPFWIGVGLLVPTVLLILFLQSARPAPKAG